MDPPEEQAPARKALKGGDRPRNKGRDPPGDRIDEIPLAQNDVCIIHDDGQQRESHRRYEQAQTNKGSSPRKPPPVVVGGMRIGSRVSVWWEQYRRFYCGTVSEIDQTKENPLFHIDHDDGDKRWEDFSKIHVRILSGGEPVNRLTVGSRVSIWWEGMSKWYPGRVTKIDQSRKDPFYIVYDDGDKRWEDLFELSFRILLPASRKDEEAGPPPPAGLGPLPRGCPPGGVWGQQTYIGRETWAENWGSILFFGPLSILCFVCNKKDKRPVYRVNDKFFKRNGAEVTCAPRDFLAYHSESRVDSAATTKCRSSSPGNRTTKRTAWTKGNVRFNRGSSHQVQNHAIGLISDKQARKAAAGHNLTDCGEGLTMCSGSKCECNEPHRPYYSQCGHDGCARCALVCGDTNKASRAIAARFISGDSGCNRSHGQGPCHRDGCPTCALVDAGGSGFGSGMSNFGNTGRPDRFFPGTVDNFSGLTTGPYGLGGRGDGNPDVTMCSGHSGQCPCNDPNRGAYLQCGHDGCIRCALEHGDKDKASRALAAAVIMNDGGPLEKRCPRDRCSCNDKNRGFHTPCHHDGCTRCAMVDAGGSGLGSGMSNFGNTAKSDNFFGLAKTGGIASGPYGLGTDGSGFAGMPSDYHGRDKPVKERIQSEPLTIKDRSTKFSVGSGLGSSGKKSRMGCSFASFGTNSGFGSGIRPSGTKSSFGGGFSISDEKHSSGIGIGSSSGFGSTSLGSTSLGKW